MRLLCPNCGAQYEVPEDHIPRKYGRDVQCSACNHTWFQTHPAQDLNPSPQDDLEGQDSLAERGDHSASTGANLETEEGGSISANRGPQTDPTRQKRPLHPSVAGVLREEAKREVEERSIAAAQSEKIQDNPESESNASRSTGSDTCLLYTSDAADE